MQIKSHNHLKLNAAMKYEFNNVVIESIAHIFPDEIISSEHIESQLKPLYDRLHLHPGRLELMTGIRERKAWTHSKLPSEASYDAAEKVLQTSSINRYDIDLLIHSSVCRDRLEPATAAYVHNKLKLSKDSQFFDVSNACLGFLNSILIVAGMIESGQIQSALITAGENGKPLLENTVNQLLNNSTISRQEIKSYFANLTIGSGAVAAVLCHKSITKNPVFSLKYASLMSNSTACTLCQGDTSGNALEMQTDSEQLLHTGLDLAYDTWNHFLDISHWTESEISHTICHQVGKRHQTLLCKRLDLDITKNITTFEFLGNTGSVALPITLSYALELHKIQKTQKLALLGIGSGISSIVFGIES